MSEGNANLSRSSKVISNYLLSLKSMSNLRLIRDKGEHVSVEELVHGRDWESVKHEIRCRRRQFHDVH